MARPRFSIGIDLGTTNCAMAFEALDGSPAASGTEVFVISQWEKAGTPTESTTLPSFLYLPTEHEAASLGGETAWVPGRLARRQSAETPGRVVHSAKSWLCHHALDRSAAFLPWHSDSLERDQHISPIQASAVLLQYLRSEWDERFAGDGAPFDAQEVTITVPASFDPVAQRLTLDAARQAGFPESVRLIEEPQAAFYRWLERHPAAEALWEALPDEGTAARHVAVIDIGGGTSDFSLFEITRSTDSRIPRIRRVAVSDHLLLGGDNIDLALAHCARERLPEGTELAPSQWNFMVAQCREIKECCLSEEGDIPDDFPVSVPGRGSGLFGGSLTTRIHRDEVRAILIDGFFPECAADAQPADEQAGLREWALPYAADSAVTRYLAAFLRGRPPVDAVLFNGGSLQSPLLRQRLQEQIAAWQHGRNPVVLENPEPDLAVARGAARCGALRHRQETGIEGGTARAVYLEVHREGAGRELVCLLPHGAEAGQVFDIRLPDLELTLGHLVEFQLYHSTHHSKDSAGDVVIWDHRSFRPLPPLQTVAKLSSAHQGKASDRLAVHLSARINDLGLLHVLCLSAEPGIDDSWPLEFNLRPHEGEPAGGGGALPADPGVDEETLAAARHRISGFFEGTPGRKDKVTANHLFKRLESLLELPKHDWNGTLIRELWSSLMACAGARRKSPDHEEAWLILAGYLLRPGFGAAGDTARIDDLWSICGAGPAHPGKRIALQQHILWRRVAGGLNSDRQQALLSPERDKLRGKKASAELVRLAGALERLDPGLKCELAAEFTTRTVELADAGQYCAPWITALGLLLNRAPLYAGPSAVLPAGQVGSTYEAFRTLEWSSPELSEIPTLFLRAARVVDDSSIDLPRDLRGKIARQLEEAGVPAVKVDKIRSFVAIESADQAGLFGESLPPGLVLASG